MKISDIVKSCKLQVVSAERSLDRETYGGYASDLLSDVMAHSQKGDIWITLQTHPNTVAVAVLKELCGIVLVNGRQPEKETAAKAEAEGIPIMTTDLPAFELIGALYAMGLRGKR